MKQYIIIQDVIKKYDELGYVELLKYIKRTDLDFNDNLSYGIYKAIKKKLSKNKIIELIEKIKRDIN